MNENGELTKKSHWNCCST